MATIAMKFGGTSVADLDRIRHVASLVKREVERGHKVAVVVSAMAGETNKLVAWTNDAARPPVDPTRPEAGTMPAGARGSANMMSWWRRANR